MLDNKKYNFLKFNGIQLIIIIFIVTGINTGYSQDKVQSDTTQQVADSTIQYITPLEYAFMMHEETSWLLKASGNLSFEIFNQFYYKLGIEKRIAPSFTLNLSFGQSIIKTDKDYPNLSSILSSLEGRWYYRLNKRIKQNKVARSMSDNYFALGFEYTQQLKNKNHEEYGIPAYNSLTTYLKWGLQRRFLKHGHADIGIKLGAGDLFEGYSRPYFALSTYVDLGLAFTKDRYKLDSEKLCPVMKCYETTNYIFKSDLSNIIRISLGEIFNSFSISPHIAFERKIGSSAFSINTELKTSLYFSSPIGTVYILHIDSTSIHLPDSVIQFRPTHYDESWGLNVEFLLEGRWYYNLKSRILKGKTGDGLSADYIALGGSYIYSTETYSRSNFNRPEIFLVSGWQRVFSKHMYYDVRIGIEYKFKTSKSYYSKGEFDPRFRIAVGYRF